jgi:hypothetical protein
MATKSPKNSIEVPRSFWNTITAMLASHMIRIGPRSRMRGRSKPSTRVPARANTSRLSTRYEAKAITKRSLASSAGWKS